jgi:hypothetical protein
VAYACVQSLHGLDPLDQLLVEHLLGAFTQLGLLGLEVVFELGDVYLVPVLTSALLGHGQRCVHGPRVGCRCDRCTLRVRKVFFLSTALLPFAGKPPQVDALLPSAPSGTPGRWRSSTATTCSSTRCERTTPERWLATDTNKGGAARVVCVPPRAPGQGGPVRVRATDFVG